ncbi:NADH-quinone oxidoreductase subunit M [Metabacillus arenae]|uniref:NADH-quinone oxidoreductase subunit M n=1 Tax=Metabacillus arenae TaxID=2771434 RepID=A0A926NKV6_9BACI|nr:NADH-quinone oxidoreductase subunit M [Metabacillus arenae]MBD1383231.1 NADH-quinone oxidoreductase subunit M [Metabacillus arenae]
MSGSLLLTVLVFSPLLGILVLSFVPRDQEKLLKLIGFLATVPAALLSIILFLQHQTGLDLSMFNEKRHWISFGLFEGGENAPYSIHYELGVDGFALVMIVLTAVIAMLAAAASIHIKHDWKSYFLLFLILELGMLGVFAAQNLFLFFLFFEATLVPMFFLIGRWGFFEREKAAYQFLIYNGLGSAILLLVISYLFAMTGTTNISLITQLLNTENAPLVGPISADMKLGLSIALLAAFGIKLPIFPLHSWMVKVHAHAPPSIVMLHAGILLKIGAFGLIRFGFGFFPNEFEKMSIVLILLGLINLLYGAFLALIQHEFKLVLAFSSISHMGIVLMGLGAMNEAGVQGAIFQVVSHGLISALLFFLVGIITTRTGTTNLSKLGGLASNMPYTAGFLLAGTMASLGLPGMSGFISEVTAFLGLFENHPELAAIGALGLILTAAYLLRATLKMTFGKEQSLHPEMSDLSWYETAPIVVLLAFILMIGIYPASLSDSLKLTVETVIKGIGG